MWAGFADRERRGIRRQVERIRQRGIAERLIARSANTVVIGEEKKP